MTKEKDKQPNIRINKVYTRSGDGGQTRLVGGEKRYKDDPRIEAYGTVDELNAHLGYCAELLKQSGEIQFEPMIKYLITIQNELFNLGTQLASPENQKTGNLPNLSGNAIKRLEQEIDASNENLGELTSFVLPGGSLINAQFHIARNVCRRAERRAVTLAKSEKVDSENIKYLNRLSDALFVWSRWVSKILGDEENLWKP